MVKFEVRSCSTDIRKVEVDDRETEKSIFIGGSRRAKISEYLKYFDTFEDAKSNLFERCTLSLERATQSFRNARDDYNKVVYLKEANT